MRNRAQLVEGSVPNNLLKLAGPMMIGVVSIMLMNAIDTFFVGRLGADALAGGALLGLPGIFGGMVLSEMLTAVVAWLGTRSLRGWAVSAPVGVSVRAK